MDRTIEYDRELLLAAANRHADRLPTELMLDLYEAVRALVDPISLPALAVVDDAETEDLLAVVRGVRTRLAVVAERSDSVVEAVDCAYVVRQLDEAERQLLAANLS